MLVVELRLVRARIMGSGFENGLKENSVCP